MEPYTILRPNTITDMLNVLHENIGASGIQMLDLPRISIPPGGSVIWNIQTPECEESPRIIEGVVVGWRNVRIFFNNAIGVGGGKQPPDCISTNGSKGVGDPGGPCNLCPYSKFGSSSNGKGQKCKLSRQLLIVRPEERLPYLLNVPPTSLKSIRQYFIALLAKGIPYWGTTTRISLVRAENNDGMPFSRMSFLSGRVLDKREREILEPYHKHVQEMLAPTTIDSRNYTDEGEPPPANTSNQLVDSEHTF
jgi:hypothetical protein